MEKTAIDSKKNLVKKGIKQHKLRKRKQDMKLD